MRYIDVVLAWLWAAFLIWVYLRRSENKVAHRADQIFSLAYRGLGPKYLLVAAVALLVVSTAYLINLLAGGQ